VIVPAQDVEGLRQAALEMFVQTMENEELEGRLRSSAPDDLAQMEKLLPNKTLAPGYYEQVLYLLWFEDKLNAGITFSEISADEAEGMAALQRARQQFQQEHPQCPHCGTRVKYRGQKGCMKCHREFS
jgi:hypothetical protein